MTMRLSAQFLPFRAKTDEGYSDILIFLSESRFIGGNSYATIVITPSCRRVLRNHQGRESVGNPISTASLARIRATMRRRVEAISAREMCVAGGRCG